MIYTGSIKSYYENNPGALDSHRITRYYRWICSCGKTQNGFQSHLVAENSLDSHLRRHFRYPDNEPLIAVEGAPDLLCEGDEVIGVSGGLWIGKRGKVVGISEARGKTPREKGRLLIEFHDPIDVPSHVFAHTHAREESLSDSKDSPETPPTNDVQSPHPPRDDASQDAQTKRLIAIIDVTPGRWTMDPHVVNSRWDLFTDEECTRLRAALTWQAAGVASDDELANEITLALQQRPKQ